MKPAILHVKLTMAHKEHDYFVFILAAVAVIVAAIVAAARHSLNTIQSTTKKTGKYFHFTSSFCSPHSVLVYGRAECALFLLLLFNAII